MNSWHPGWLTRRTPAARGLWLLTVDVSKTALAKAHPLPGQFVKVHVGDGPELYLALASEAQDERPWEFLVKEGSASSNALLRLPLPAALRVSDPAGPGFPLHKAVGHNLLLFAAGSGISALRPVIQSVLRQRSAFGDVTLFFGAQSPDAFAFQEEFPSWKNARIQILQTVSLPASPPWNGLSGYVQHHVQASHLKNALAFLVGPQAMVTDVTDTLVKLGLDGTHIFVNI